MRSIIAFILLISKPFMLSICPVLNSRNFIIDLLYLNARNRRHPPPIRNQINHTQNRTHRHQRLRYHSMVQTGLTTTETQHAAPRQCTHEKRLIYPRRVHRRGQVQNTHLRPSHDQHLERESTPLPAATCRQYELTENLSLTLPLERHLQPTRSTHVSQDCN